MRSSPRLVAPASTAARIAARLECIRPKRRSVNASRKPVREFTSPQKVGDPDARHEHIDRAVEAFARGRRHRIVRRDAQTGVLEAHAIEPTACQQLRSHFAQALVQPFASIGEPDPGVGLAPAFGEHLLGFVRRRQIGVEAAIIPTEPRRVYRRLQLLRGLEHEQIKSIFPRG